MKLIINKSIFENVITSIQPFLDKKDASSITSHILLVVDNNNLTIKATDYEMGYKAVLTDIKDCISGSATVNGANLLGIIRRLKNEDIIIEKIEDNLLIKQNRSSFKLPMYNPDEFPSFPELNNLNKLEVDTVSLINCIKKITPAIDNNNPKFELNGALIDIKQNKINFVATDTRRLAVTYVDKQSTEAKQLIIPKKAIIEIQKLFLDETTILYDDTNLVINSNNVTFFTRLINGKFPDYERIIPNSLKYNLSLPKDQLVESIKLVTSIFANIKITFSSNSIVFESLDENSEAKTQIDIDLPVDSTFYLAANSKYLLDFLSLVNNNNITIGFNESNLPFYLEDGKFSTIIMPLILDR